MSIQWYGMYFHTEKEGHFLFDSGNKSYVYNYQEGIDDRYYSLDMNVQADKKYFDEVIP